MFQAWLVKIAKIEAHSAPSLLPGKRPMKNVTGDVRKPGRGEGGARALGGPIRGEEHHGDPLRDGNKKEYRWGPVTPRRGRSADRSSTGGKNSTRVRSTDSNPAHRGGTDGYRRGPSARR